MLIQINRSDKFREECGLMAVWNHKEAANIAYLGLYAQQHRGQEGAGVVALNRQANSKFSIHKGRGLVSDVFEEFDFNLLPGDTAIGHVRYSTAGGNVMSNVQPFFAEISVGRMALAHNGNLINADELRAELIADGSIFSSTSDTEVVIHLIARNPAHQPLVENVIGALKRVKGAYSFVMLFQDRILAVRDPAGLRPLCLGRLGDSYIVASETCAFDLLDAEYVRDIEAGELVEISGDNKITSYFPFARQKESPCIFEYVYFARPDSSVFGRNVYEIRKRLGTELARESPVKNADVVVPVPDSGTAAALGFAQETKLPLELGLIRNHYVGRTFIEPKQTIRDFGAKVKLNPNPGALKGKVIVVVDDSIVRGTTSRKLVAMLRKAGAKEIHMRISAPPTTDPCYYGIDTPKKEELIASHKSVDGIAEFIGVDSLAYLSVEGLYRAVNAKNGTMCDACFTGNYPIGTPQMQGKKQAPLF
ncbi:MAG: amidophosphoribosyltransferase [Oligoflexia bacterium]|nr:amidophosphoribosyltransferase [Oligoflexia bacterium]